MSSDDNTRHSKALEAQVVSDPDEQARLEARNGVRQFDAVTEMIEYFSHPERKFKLRPSHLLHLQRFALDGLSAYAGNYRPADIEIGGSKHKPPGAHMVPEEVEYMCDYVNENWEKSSPVHLAAYVLWKLNWIHPFTDGNGRTARAISYLLLCLRLGYRLPGTNTIPEQISKDKKPYYQALEAADEEWTKEKVDLSQLEDLLSALLANQLVGIHEQATGKKRDASR
jgi:Fic family protein